MAGSGRKLTLRFLGNALLIRITQTADAPLALTETRPTKAERAQNRTEGEAACSVRLRESTQGVRLGAGTIEAMVA